MEGNTLGEWSDGDDAWIWDVDGGTIDERSGSDNDELTSCVGGNVQTGGGKKRKNDEMMRTLVLHHHHPKRTCMW